jgi:hypothetical protein
MKGCYKPICWGMKLLPFDLSRRLLDGMFEHAIAQTSYIDLFGAKKGAVSVR